MTDFAKAKEFYTAKRKQLLAMEYVNFLIDWDAQTEAPRNSVDTEAPQQAVLAEMTYRMQTDPEFCESVETLYLNKDKLDDVLRHEVEVLKKDIENTKKIPMEEYTAFQETVANGYPVYVDAKRGNDFASFLPILEKIVDYSKKLTVWLESDKLKGYDVLLDMYEPSFTKADYDKFFDVLREKLVPFVKKVTSLKLDYDRSFANQSYSVDKQKEFCEYMRDVMCFDKSRGVMKESEHPFTLGFGTDDVRITVHYYPDNFVSGIFSAIHETGHALYEQQVDKSLNVTLSKGGASLGIHESQSRFYENIIGRSEMFWRVHYPKLQKIFPEQLKDVELDRFMKYINTAECTFVRTEADELTYSLHIMLRYEMEREFIEGDLKPEDFPKYWNEKFEEYFGITPPNDTQGVLQDVHWAYGNVGYFPTYALGSAIAAQLYAKMSAELDIEKALESGNTSEINAWLGEHVHKYGASKYPKEILQLATGEDFDPTYYVDYLIKKYSKVYGI